ncbi:MAG: glycosyltransferase family 1 protein [bacterium]
MKIAIDMRSLSKSDWAGKQKYVFGFLKELFKIDQKNQYILYVDEKIDFNAPNNYCLKIILGGSMIWHIKILFDLIKTKPDIYFGATSYIVPALNIFTENIIIIYDLVSFLPDSNKNHNKKAKYIEKLFMKLACRNSRRIISISENTKKDLIKIFKIDPKIIQTVYPACSREFKIIEDENYLSEIRKKYDLPENFLLFVGTLEPRKNLIKLIESYNKFIGEKEFENYKLILVGKKGWHYDEIFRKVEELNLQNKIIFLGYAPDDDVPAFYNLASCFIYPSIYEGFGMPVIEAMRCGCPVITSNTSSLPEAAGDKAVLVDPESIDEIVTAIKNVLSDNVLRESMKKKGIEWSKKFSWENTARDISGIIDNLFVIVKK